jgi:hypothetical protein
MQTRRRPSWSSESNLPPIWPLPWPLCLLGQTWETCALGTVPRWGEILELILTDLAPALCCLVGQLRLGTQGPLECIQLQHLKDVLALLTPHLNVICRSASELAGQGADCAKQVVIQIGRLAAKPVLEDSQPGFQAVNLVIL